MSFLGEIKRRKIFQVAAVYLVVAWLLIQIVATVETPLNLPDWVDTFVILLLAIGFPVTLIMSWGFNLTPDGLVKDRGSVASVPNGGKRIEYVLIGLLVVTVGWILYRTEISPSEQPVELLAEEAERDALPNSVAVLPFENLSPDPNDAYFAAGIHEQIINELAKIRDLSVIARTSVMQYAGAARPMTEIADELRVEMLMEGSVRYAADQVRVTAQLIDGVTGIHIWNNDYDGDLIDIFGIQTEIATAIAEALQATLSPEEVARLRDAPTRNMRAYDFYLSGEEYLRSTNIQTDRPLAVQQFQRAVEEDPDFALAFARLSTAHNHIYHQSIDRTEARLSKVLSTARRALELEPGLPEAHVALVFYHLLLGDLEAALGELAVAEQGMPGDLQLIATRALLYREQGQWQQALAGYDRANELDPRSEFLLFQQGNNYLALRDYAQAERYLDRALDIAPDYAVAYVVRTQIPLFRDGDAASAKAAIEDSPIDLGDFWQRFRWRAAISARDYDAALDGLDEWDIEVDEGQGYFAPKASYYGVTYQLAGQPERAEHQFQIARAQIEEALENDSDYSPKLIALGEILVGLGETESAIRHADQAIALLPTLQDALAGPVIHLDVITRVLAPAGATDAAIEQLDAYLAAPGFYSIEGILPDPRLDPIRDEPLFHALVEKYGRQ